MVTAAVTIAKRHVKRLGQVASLKLRNEQLEEHASFGEGCFGCAVYQRETERKRTENQKKKKKVHGPLTSSSTKCNQRFPRVPVHTVHPLLRSLTCLPRGALYETAHEA